MPRINELYAFVIADKDEDDEGVPAFTGANGMLYPMMGADIERANSLHNMAATLARTSGKPIKLIRSTGIEIVETIQP